MRLKNFSGLLALTALMSASPLSALAHGDLPVQLALAPISWCRT